MPDSSAQPGRELHPFNDGWLFRRHDPADSNDISAHLTYAKLQPWVGATGLDLIGAATPAAKRPVRPAIGPAPLVSFTRPGFDDSEWAPVNVPHDWAIAGPFDQALPGDTGKLSWQGVGWYRKRFKLSPADAAGRRVELEFEGAMAQPTIWLNGHCVGGWVYGYSSFRVDLTDYLAADGDNVLAVRLNNLPESSRWYPGAGIYRPVWLSLTPALRFTPWGVHVTTPRITADRAWVEVDMVIEQNDANDVECTLTTALFAADIDGRRTGDALATSRATTLQLRPLEGRQGHRRHTIALDEPRRWDLATPHRYVAVSRIEVEGACIDEVETVFGVRTIRFDSDHGFFLNEHPVPIRGVCQHHDLGALGAAVNRRALERQLEILREMGCNAIRTAHNPPAPDLLELCDRMGFLVMDEAFDCWRMGKRRNDYAQFFDEWHERDLRAMIRRDRNHPSIILWSIGNEIIEQDVSDGWKVAAHLAAMVREEDRSRPITVGCNREISAQTGYQTAVDVIGFNYKPWAYAALHEIHPLMPTYGSETASCVSSRGEYFFPVSDDKAAGQADFQVSSYDLAAPFWAWAPDHEFAGLDDSPQAAGEFVWTGFDYLGEPTPYNADRSNLLNFSDPTAQAKMAAQLEALGRLPVPSRSSYFGIVDLAGFPKDRFYLYQARWRPELPMAHLLPHWNWPEREGEITPVHLYTSGDEAELFLNGRSLGKRRRSSRDYRLRWDDVVYELGELRAVVTRAGEPWAEASRHTTGVPARIELEADRASAPANGVDLIFVTVRIVDEAGRTVPRSKPELSFAVEGAGELAAVDNGDATSHVSFHSPTLPAFNGLALAIIRPARQAGTIELSVRSADLPPASLSLNVTPSPA